MAKLMFSFLLCVNRLDHHLDKAIKSVLNQTDPDFDFFIIANNCDEDLWEFLSAIEDERIKLYRTNIGQLAFNLNYGINLIKSDYILRMDADDICFLNRLELTKKQLAAHNYPSVLAGGCQYIDEFDKELFTSENEYLPNEVMNILWKRNPICHPSTALCRKTLLSVGCYSWGLNSEDYDLWLRLVRNGKDIVVCKDMFLKYRLSDGQTRGGVLPYSEVSGLLLKEFLITKKATFLVGTILAVAKRIIKAK
jgi:hypothetical protein